jgi:hypothetical protein
MNWKFWKRSVAQATTENIIIIVAVQPNNDVFCELMLPHIQNVEHEELIARQLSSVLCLLTNGKHELTSVLQKAVSECCPERMSNFVLSTINSILKLKARGPKSLVVSPTQVFPAHAPRDDNDD